MRLTERRESDLVNLYFANLGMALGGCWSVLSKRKGSHYIGVTQYRDVANGSSRRGKQASKHAVSAKAIYSQPTDD